MNYVNADIEENSAGTVYSNCNLGCNQLNIFNGTAIAAGETWYFGPGFGPGSQPKPSAAPHGPGEG